MHTLTSENKRHATQLLQRRTKKKRKEKSYSYDTSRLFGMQFSNIRYKYIYLFFAFTLRSSEILHCLFFLHSTLCFWTLPFPTQQQRFKASTWKDDTLRGRSRRLRSLEISHAGTEEKCAPEKSTKGDWGGITPTQNIICKKSNDVSNKACVQWVSEKQPD